MPSAASSLAVPPVETISTSSSARPRAKSVSARLSETLSSARRMRTSPGAVTSVPRGSIDIVDQAHGTRQQPVLHAVQTLLDLGDGRRIRKLQRLLKDDRAAVQVLVDEVNRHSRHLRP